MPHSTPSLKVSLVKKFGGKNIKIKLVGENFSKAYKAAMDYCIKGIEKHLFIHLMILKLLKARLPCF